MINYIPIFNFFLNFIYFTLIAEVFKNIFLFYYNFYLKYELVKVSKSIHSELNYLFFYT